MSIRIAAAILTSAMVVTASACARGGVWERVPLAPRLEFVERVEPGTLVLLVTDAHSGAPVNGAAVRLSLPSRGGCPIASGACACRTCSPGEHTVHVRRIGYESRIDTVRVRDGQGVAMLVQLRRTKIILVPVSIGPGPDPAT